MKTSNGTWVSQRGKSVLWISIFLLWNIIYLVFSYSPFLSNLLNKIYKMLRPQKGNSKSFVQRHSLNFGRCNLHCAICWVRGVRKHKGFWGGTVVNLALPFLHGGSLEIQLTFLFNVSDEIHFITNTSSGFKTSTFFSYKYEIFLKNLLFIITKFMQWRH